ncbi:uncharacterized protein EDB93DRAFT_366823 [Suillus bovinus]|uniref:uncharacterized protein n=1 Tax=Suillus bovinus TaxID=48563 RepID=UPI001B85FACD|nr:uncharacterized protein EDB93DRAFT_366823 [Suillus bovinus]KAG2148633.1 hypothetical protein EDB93DRAFT_366823 [Suillus bovinus]
MKSPVQPHLHLRFHLRPPHLHLSPGPIHRCPHPNRGVQAQVLHPLPSAILLITTLRTQFVPCQASNLHLPNQTQFSQVQERVMNLPPGSSISWTPVLILMTIRHRHSKNSSRLCIHAGRILVEALVMGRDQVDRSRRVLEMQVLLPAPPAAEGDAQGEGQDGVSKGEVDGVGGQDSDADSPDQEESARDKGKDSQEQEKSKQDGDGNQGAVDKSQAACEDANLASGGTQDTEPTRLTPAQEEAETHRNAFLLKEVARLEELRKRECCERKNVEDYFC